MNQYKLSVLIPARNEEFLAKTVQDLLENSSEQTEILVGLDGSWASPSISQDPRVNVIYTPESIGQRAMTNLLCRLSKAKYVAKADAHTKWDKDWDLKMFEAFNIAGDNATIAPAMYNLWAFDWVCPDGHRRYQSPSGPCRACGKPTTKEVTWRITAERGETARGQWKNRHSPFNTSYCFDPEPHFQYMSTFRHRPEGQGDLTESMSLQGSCFMCTREKYWELNLCDEALGSWGSQGIEVACKTWLSGGRVMVYHKTWYAHLFRTQGGDFGFPYEQDTEQNARAKRMVRDLFFQNKWEKQVKPLSWLVEKFWPIPGWDDKSLSELKKNDILVKNAR